MFRRIVFVAGLLLGMMSGPVALAQLDVPALRGFTPNKPAGVTHSLVADVKDIVPGKPFRIGILFDVKDGNHFYYKKAGSLGLPTTIKFEAPQGFTIGPVEFPAPEVKHDKLDTPVIYYVYTRPTLIFAEVTPPSDLKPDTTIDIKAQISYQFCDESNCIPVNDKSLQLSLPVTKGPSAAPSDYVKTFTRAARQLPKSDDPAAVVTVEPFLSADAIRPNDQFKLALDIEIAAGFHIQMHRPPDDTLISTEVILETPDDIDFNPPVYPEPLKPIHPLEGFENIKEYRNRLTVIVPLRARKFIKPGQVEIRGFVRYQACDDNGCQPTAYAPFKISVPVTPEGSPIKELRPEVFASAASEPPASAPPTSLPPINTPPAAEAPVGNSGDVLANIQNQHEEDLGDNLAVYLLYAFLGGLILNVMPCVLPVIAIKVLGFVNQAGENRFQILLLNVAYSAGVLAVFLTLASLAAFAGLGWGELFQSSYFNLGMASIVFAMGLSLLGVFEIPVPGFAGSVDLTKKEGPLGAFLTGMLATLLATPCSGPFMGVTLTWSVRQPPHVIYAVWGIMGLGMASPYLLCGLFPGAIKMLPKPGMWMVRFKELAGFVLLGTVVYIVSYLNSVYVLPLLVILLGVAVATWMIDNLYEINSPVSQKLRVRAASAGILALSVAFSIFFVKPLAEKREAFRSDAEFQKRLAALDAERLAPVKHSEEEIAWIPFTETNLRKYVDEKKTVFIDFTADWCLVCKNNEARAIETDKIRSIIKEYGIVPLKADWTERSLEIKEWLDKFDGASLPHYVIIPARDASRPIVFAGSLTEAKVEKKLREAGPSKGVTTEAATAQISMAK